ncbi:MAG: AAA family ATPase [Flavobacteriales bacterium]|nr:AAA family ATPase [Flavobacteriales bacterium]
MKYTAFKIQGYRAIEKPVVVDLSKAALVPLVGINECGKTTILQGIYCFDSINDSEYGGKHMKDTKNLYRTSESTPPMITATIATSFAALADEYADFVEEESLEAETLDQEESGVPAETAKAQFPANLNAIKSQFDGRIHIVRDLDSKKYDFVGIRWPSEFKKSIVGAFARYLVGRLPYILYNDDFMDRPPAKLKVPKARPSRLTGWLAIYERLFELTPEKYSLFTVGAETDQRRRDAILSDVEAHLNSTLTKAWKSFLLNKHGAVTIRLRFNPGETEHELEVSVVERIDGRERFFDVIDRSKGFLWFFNFVMKLEFNPKVLDNTKGTVYLLDEPGSYLHNSAQQKLCKKLVDLSDHHGSVIYCTHSHMLLDPQHIPLNHIHVVEKRSNKQILATPLPQAKTTKEATMALQPVLEALQISAFDYAAKGSSLVAVEGIYDKYAIECCVDLPENTTLLPGTSADSIIKNIQYLNGFEMRYVALWDNDSEGRKMYKKATDLFGQDEAKKFAVLPLEGLQKRRMEEMFEPEDLIMLDSELNLHANASYERVISGLYFASPTRRRILRAKLSTSTVRRFNILKDILAKHFQAGDDLRKARGE